MMNRVATGARRCAVDDNLTHLREDSLLQGSQTYILLGNTSMGMFLLKCGLHVTGNQLGKACPRQVPYHHGFDYHLPVTI
jgi:hypothetical protein